MLLFFILFFTQKSRFAIYCFPLGLGVFILDYRRGRRNREMVLHRVTDKISRSVVVVPLERSPDKSVLKACCGKDFQTGSSGSETIVSSLKSGPFAPLVSEILL